MKTEIYLPDVVGKGYASFWKDKHRYRVLKGGRASKKSTTMALWTIYNIMKYPNANMLCVRKTGNTHKDSTYAELKKAAKRLGVYDKWTFTLSPLECRYNATGQKILFRGFDDPLKLTSITVDTGVLCWVWLEEAYEIDNEAEFATLDESIRGEMPEGLWKQITLTFNPWINSHWTKDRFFDQQDPNAFTLTTTHKCNEFLDQADHDKIELLKGTDPERYLVVGLGEYGIPGGVYFPEFRKSIHTCKPFAIPNHWKRYVSMDYGMDMLACYWIAVNEQGRCYVYRELYEGKDNGKGENQMGHIVSAAAERIKEYNNGDDIYLYLAPPDLWNRNRDSGRSTADIFDSCGICLMKTSNNRINGWRAVKEQLNPIVGEHGNIVSNLTIFDNCRNLIRTLPSVQCDEKNPEDVATEPHELTHAPDAIRGFCVYWFDRAKELSKPEDFIHREFDLGQHNNNAFGVGEKIDVI